MASTKQVVVHRKCDHRVCDHQVYFMPNCGHTVSGISHTDGCDGGLKIEQPPGAPDIIARFDGRRSGNKPCKQHLITLYFRYPQEFDAPGCNCPSFAGLPPDPLLFPVYTEDELKRRTAFWQPFQDFFMQTTADREAREAARNPEPLDSGFGSQVEACSTSSNLANLAHDDVCPICYCSLLGSPFGLDEPANARRLNCGHHYHFSCLTEWFVQCPSCPLRCKLVVPQLRNPLEQYYDPVFQKLEHHPDHVILKSGFLDQQTRCTMIRDVTCECQRCREGHQLLPIHNLAEHSPNRTVFNSSPTGWVGEYDVIYVVSIPSGTVPPGCTRLDQGTAEIGMETYMINWSMPIVS